MHTKSDLIKLNLITKKTFYDNENIVADKNKSMKSNIKIQE